MKITYNLKQMQKQKQFFRIFLTLIHTFKLPSVPYELEPDCLGRTSEPDIVPCWPQKEWGMTLYLNEQQLFKHSATTGTSITAGASK